MDRVKADAVMIAALKKVKGIVEAGRLPEEELRELNRVLKAKPYWSVKGVMMPATDSKITPSAEMRRTKRRG